MENDNQYGQKNNAMQILGAILIIAGFYGLTLSIVNTVAFSKYPTEGVYSINIKGSPDEKREEDCRIIEDLNQIDNLTEEKKEAQKSNLDICWGGVSQERIKVKILDYTQSAVLFILGLMMFSLSFSLKKLKL